VLPERDFTPAAIREADLLVTRSKVRLDRRLLEGSRVRFVGTATAGTDHMDLDYLNRAGIAWYAAAGCNADSVAEYVVAALLLLALRQGAALAGRTLAVIGVGQVGRRVAEKARVLGLPALLNDPPRQEAEGDPAFRPLAEILPQADIVTLHVPLTETGRHPTRRLASEAFFNRLKRGCWFINAARGEVADTAALLAARAAGRVSRAALDVFEGEPACPAGLPEAADLLTPHIAGYSHPGKLNGTLQVYQAACRFLGQAADWQPTPAPDAPSLLCQAAGRAEEDVLRELVNGVYDIQADDRAYRAGLAAESPASGRCFERLRSGYPVRHEFPQAAVRLAGASLALLDKVKGLGFRPDPAGG
jgi:erythronate-4-phosphate dehydrogenase